MTTFYVVCAGAVATLVGLLFVAVQIGPPWSAPAPVGPRHAIARLRSTDPRVLDKDASGVFILLFVLALRNSWNLLVEATTT